MNIIMKLLPAMAVFIGIWFVVTIVARGEEHILVRMYRRFKPLQDDSALVEVETIVQPEYPVAHRILTSTKVRGCFIGLLLFSDRVERYVKFKPTMAKRIGSVKVVLETIHDSVTERSTLTITRETEQLVREMVKKLDKDAPKSEYIPKAIASQLFHEAKSKTEVEEAVVVEKSAPTAIAKYFGVINGYGVDKSGAKPVYFIDLAYRDGAVHRIKGWALKMAIEKSEAQQGDTVELSSVKEDEKIRWNLKFCV